MTNDVEVNWLKELKKLERYCNKQGYAVVYRPVEIDSIYYDEKLIILSDTHKDEISLYCLLHEMGHATLFGSRIKYNLDYDYIWGSFSRSSSTYRITTVQEELDAWREGLKLAKKLRLKIDRRKFEITKAKCISTYLSWANKR